MLKEYMLREALPRLDAHPDIKKGLLSQCRLKKGEIWTDPAAGHKVGCLDATVRDDVCKLLADEKTSLVINDPPYNLSLDNKNTQNLFKFTIDEYTAFSKKWLHNTLYILRPNAHFYLWLGADQNAGFEPLPELIMMMRDVKELSSRSFITMRNQRGYGTQKNWMAVRQELLYYVKGSPPFQVVYTDIPKVLKGYYKVVKGKKQENLARSKSSSIRAGNVWIDIQQIFYRMEENVPGAYAQKPLKAYFRILQSSSCKGDLVVDLFSHSGTTLLAAEIMGRRCYTCDNDPVFAEITIRRLEHYRRTGKLGFQCSNPFTAT
jgi:site-specific DNA-methyltransferase (adenine-specific)